MLCPWSPCKDEQSCCPKGCYGQVLSSSSALQMNLRAFLSYSLSYTGEVFHTLGARGRISRPNFLK